MRIQNKFEIGQAVCLVADIEQVIRQVVYITITPIGLTYGVRYDSNIDEVYEIELTSEPNELKKLGLKEPKPK